MTTMWLKDKIDLYLRRADTLPSAAPDILETIAAALQWDIGEFWEMREGVLVRTATWPPAPIAWARPDAAQGAEIPPGFGVPGRAWTSRRPVWITDVRTESSMFCRASSAIDEGLTTACAFPVVSGGEPVGVLLFMSRARRRPELDTIETLASIAETIGVRLRGLRLPPSVSA